MYARFIAATIVICCGGAWAITLAVPGRDVSRSVWTSAAVVIIVQTIGFSVVRTMAPLNVFAGWGLGMILRAIVLVAFGFFGVKALGLSLQPALLSMAGFFFVSTVVEPAFLKP